MILKSVTWAYYKWKKPGADLHSWLVLNVRKKGEMGVHKASTLVVVYGELYVSIIESFGIMAKF